MTDLFAFLRAEWPDVHDAASRAASAVHPDPRTACFYARRALELGGDVGAQARPRPEAAYDENLSALIHEPTFKGLVGETVFMKARLIVKAGNEAVHRQRAIPALEAIAAVRELFHVAYWFARTYARDERPDPTLAFDPTVLPFSAPLPRQTVEQLQKLEGALRERDEKLSAPPCRQASPGRRPGAGARRDRGGQEGGRRQTRSARLLRGGDPRHLDRRVAERGRMARADALQRGQAGAVPRRPRGPGEPGRQRLQETPAGGDARESGHGEERRGSGLRVDVPHHHGSDQRCRGG